MLVLGSINLILLKTMPNNEQYKTHPLNKLGISWDSESNNFYYTNTQQEKVAITTQEAEEFANKFAELEKKAQNTSKGSAEELLAMAGIAVNKSGQYVNRSAESVPPQKLLAQLNSLIETDKLLQGMNFSHINRTIINIPVLSETGETHQAMHTKNIIQNIENTAKFIAGFAGMGISLDDDSCCDLSRLKPQFSNDGSNEKAVLFEWETRKNSLSFGVKSPNTVKGISAYITGTWR